jgi:hypothetical protein
MGIFAVLVVGDDGDLDEVGTQDSVFGRMVGEEE